MLVSVGCNKKTEVGGDAPAPVMQGVENPTTPQIVPKFSVKPLQNGKASLDFKRIGTCAVVDLSQTPTGALFESKVLGSRNLSWVERGQVDKVVRELELQALFSPQGGSKRAGLGKLLQADALVMLRATEASDEMKTKVLEIVVCESQYGLRLAVKAIPLTGTAEIEVEQLESVLNAALAKLAGKITEVCAVPPFISHDLDYRYDYLKAAFARTLEQHLLNRPGVLVVELVEAQTLAKEAFLAGKNENLARRLPLFFLGAFRNEGKEDHRRLQLDLTLRRGDKELGARQVNGILPSDAL